MKKFLLLCIALTLSMSMVNAVCGNHTCESAENFTNCPADCDPGAITIEVLEFDASQSYMRGEEIFIKIKVLADGSPVSDPNVSVIGFFGSMKLYDDGNHGDDKKFDTVFANSFIIPANAIEGTKVLKITAEKRGVVGTVSVEMELDASLELSMTINDDRFVLSDAIELDGQLKRRGLPIQDTIAIYFLFDGNTLVSAYIEPDENGSFSYTYHTSVIDPLGKWTISAGSVDAKGNRGTSEKTFELYKGIQDFYYNLEFVEPLSKIFSRGDVMKFLVEITDEDGNFVDGANVNISLPNTETLKLNEITTGSYTNSYKLPYDFGLGRRSFTVVASKDINGFLFSGFSSKEAIIDKGKIFVDLVKPEKRIFYFGDAINFEFELHYFDNTSVSKAIVDLKVNNKLLQVEEVSRGLYHATYIVSDEIEIERMLLFMGVKDQSENLGEYSEEFEIRAGGGPLYSLQRNTIFIIGFGGVMLFALFIAALYVRKILKAQGHGKRKVELERLIEELRQQYFEKGKIKSGEYREILNRYQSEIDEIDAALSAEESK
ncbi:MAG: hypothetical protein CL943_00235 [Candidatus Diapherotrites archaeon]|uniref:Uncharacterized protein n=1 Tax=Candidatus Iainarchaeum sp. TaxID=3101447 RepID=A0A2D6LZW2_9ARCH|nr:hypothetical protein [Candidatus Diapherotrites archaeon]|tara:strand:- start:846 stop:2483 length:1638 start_codon:yes stop_codon:yes gene_type:complete